MENNSKKRKDVSALVISLIVALILAIGAGIYVYFKNQSNKKYPEVGKTSYFRSKRTKLTSDLLNRDRISTLRSII